MLSKKNAHETTANEKAQSIRASAYRTVFRFDVAVRQMLFLCSKASRQLPLSHSLSLSLFPSIFSPPRIESIFRLFSEHLQLFKPKPTFSSHPRIRSLRVQSDPPLIRSDSLHGTHSVRLIHFHGSQFLLPAELLVACRCPGSLLGLIPQKRRMLFTAELHLDRKVESTEHRNPIPIRY